MKPSKNKNAAIDPPAKISRRRLWVFRLLALALPVLALGLLECGLRLGDYGFDPHFFKPVTIGGTAYFVQNDDFSYQFFPRKTARNPGTLRMLAQKPPGTLRIFVLGESAAMGDPEPAYGPARFMEMQLRAKFPDARFEVVNVAFTAINSHVILPIARECAKHDGDFWIVYMGNNEMVGPFGASTVFGKQAPPLPYVRLVSAIKRTRTGQLLDDLIHKLRHEKAPAASWGGMQMFLKNQLTPDSPLRQNVYLNFEKNLADILQAGQRSGAKILLNTVAVNLKDCAPFASLSASSTPSANREQAKVLGDQARVLMATNHFVQAETVFTEATRGDSQNAGLQFDLGQSLLALGQTSAARAHLQAACDDDALPFRTDSRLNHIITDTAQKMPAGKVVLFDAAQALAAQNPAGVCGDETFYEHVHFDFAGSYRLGLAWAEQITRLLPPTLKTSGAGWLTEAECDQFLGLSDWNRVAVWQHMLNRLQVPPFNDQPNNAERMARLKARIEMITAAESPARAREARSNFLAQINRAPDDFFLRENFALFLQAAGDIAGAIEQWRGVIAMLPTDYVPRFQIGRLLGHEGQWHEAEAQLRTALKIHPSLTEGWVELGNVLASQQKFDEALDCYAQALEQRPHDSLTLFRIGKVHALQGDHRQAIELYQAALNASPENWEAHFELGGECDAAGQADAALTEFAAATRLNPQYSRTHFNYGVLLAKHGRLDEAEREFQTALQLEPDYANAREALQKIRLLKKPPEPSPNHVVAP